LTFWIVSIFVGKALNAQKMYPLLFLVSFLTQADFFEKTDQFLQQHVDQRGLVDYQQIRSNPEAMDQLVAQIASFPFDQRDQPDQKAFLINAYNLLVIKQVVDQYPLKSPLDDPDFFSGVKHQVAGRQVSLDQLEKSWLFQEFPDERLHFVLVCAARSCPPLSRRAFTGKALEQQIENEVRKTLNSNFVRADGKKAGVSRIFEWYEKDFGVDPITYINQYREKPLEQKRFFYYEYDWTINDQSN
jgi:hypothetical protein